MTWFKNLSIKNKLILIQTTTAFIVVLICCIFFVLNDIRTFKESGKRKLFSLARIVGENAISTLVFLDQDAATRILSKLTKEPDIAEAVLLDRNGNLFARHSREQPTTGTIDLKNEMRSEAGAEKLTINYKLYQDNEFLGTLVLNAQLNDLHKIVTGYIQVAGLVLLTAIIASLLISLFLQRSIVFRLLRLVSKTKAVAKTGNYSLRVGHIGNDEIGMLAGSFNAMLAQIEKMDSFLKETNAALKTYSTSLERKNRELEEFAYISSHDMKSPVTSLRGLLTLMQEKDAIKPEHRNIFNLAVNSVSQIQKTINALNEIIAFRKTLRIEREKIDLGEALEEVRLRILDHNADQVVINADFTQCRHVNFPPVHLKSIFQNLLTNAIKYKQEGKPAIIDITSTSEENFVVLEVKDNGMGIDMDRFKDKLFGLFQRFHTHTEGAGIGLHVIHSIVESYGGRIYVDSVVDRGTTFKIYLDNAPLQ